MMKHKALMTPDGPMSYREAARFYNIPVGTIASRRASGWSDFDVVNPHRSLKKDIMIEMNGDLVRLTDYVGAGTIEYDRAVRRHSRGVTGDDLFAPAYRMQRRPGYRIYVTAYGVKTLTEMSEILNIPYPTLKTRNSLGWIHDEIFNTPVFGVRGVHFIIPRKEYERKKREHEKTYIENKTGIVSR